MTSRVSVSFWRFVKAVYGCPGVAEACLDLQDRHGADVTLLFFALFSGASGRGRLDADQLRQAIATVAPWRDGVIVALRQIRRAMRQPLGGISDEALRRQIGRAELAAERRQIATLSSLLPPARQGVSLSDRTSDAAANIAAYLALLPGRPPAAHQRLIELLTNAALSPSTPV